MRVHSPTNESSRSSVSKPSPQQPTVFCSSTHMHACRCWHFSFIGFSIIIICIHSFDFGRLRVHSPRSESSRSREVTGWHFIPSHPVTLNRVRFSGKRLQRRNEEEKIEDPLNSDISFERDHTKIELYKKINEKLPSALKP